MKLTQSKIAKSKSGMTLLELTVVILVLLSLISILFIGGRAWKRGSDRAATIMTIRNVQQAVRSHQNMSGHNPEQIPLGVHAMPAAIFGEGKFIEKVPAGLSYTIPGDTPTEVKGEGVHPAGVDAVFAFTTDSTSGTKFPEIGKLYIESDAAEGKEFDSAYFNPSAADVAGW